MTCQFSNKHKSVVSQKCVFIKISWIKNFWGMVTLSLWDLNISYERLLHNFEMHSRQWGIAHLGLVKLVNCNQFLSHVADENWIAKFYVGRKWSYKLLVCSISNQLMVQRKRLEVLCCTLPCILKYLNTKTRWSLCLLISFLVAILTTNTLL